ncbi:MAG: DUF2220 domain-containing protein [Treponema sp.]|jgi:hypothetical protein|nr:DUF2220 domain-containing protein [Treponema sp.]
MRSDYGKQILNILMDWYENSPAYVRGQKPSRRRIMRLYDDGKTDFSAYNIEDHLIRNDINHTVLVLAEKGFIHYQWLPGQQDHILAKLWLNSSAIEQTYIWLGRRPKGDVVEDLLLQLTTLLNKTETNWARRWLEDTIKVILKKRSIGAIMSESSSERDDLLKAVSYLANNTEIETLERVFSMRCYGDSKHFERSVKARLVRILRKYLVQDDCSDEDALRLAGIVPYPEQFAFSGSLSIVFPQGTLDFTPLSFGGTLTIDDIRKGRIVLGEGIQRVLSIENRANYVDYIHKVKRSDEFILFHSGQFSPAKRIFLNAIVSSLPGNCGFFHWGDIDYGGFSMLARLRREILPMIQPWRMNQNELTQYAKFTAGFSDTYRKRLATLLNMPELSDCYPCIEYMIKTGVRLEQEAMLT